MQGNNSKSEPAALKAQLDERQRGMQGAAGPHAAGTLND